MTIQEANQKVQEWIDAGDSYATLDLNELKSAEGLTLPTEVGGLLQLKGLTSVVGLNLPETVKRLDLNGLNSAEGLKFPKKSNCLG